MQVWSLDVDAAEQQVAVGGVSPQLQLYRIHSDSETGGASSASKQVRSPPAREGWIFHSPGHALTGRQVDPERFLSMRAPTKTRVGHAHLAVHMTNCRGQPLW